MTPFGPAPPHTLSTCLTITTCLTRATCLTVATCPQRGAVSRDAAVSAAAPARADGAGDLGHQSAAAPADAPAVSVPDAGRAGQSEG